MKYEQPFEYPILRKAKTIYLYDFNGGKAGNISAELAAAKIENDNYTEVESTFSRKGILLELTAHWHKFSFLFDPAFAAQIQADTSLLSFKTNFQPVSDLYSTDSVKRKVYVNQNIAFCNINYNAAFLIGNKLQSKLGLDFISKFDWIIDFRKQKVYCRKNSFTMQTATCFQKAFGASYLAGQLIVVHKDTKIHKFNVGDVITAVNGEKLTTENARQVQLLLQKGINMDAVTFTTP